MGAPTHAATPALLSLSFSVSLVVGSVGCEAEEYDQAADAFENAPEPDGKVPAVLKGGIWKSGWDNPPMMGYYHHEALEKTESDPSVGWYHARFDLMTAQEASVANYNFSHFAIPGAGSYDKNSQSMEWTTHGMSLPPRVTKAPDEGVVKFYLQYNDPTPGTFVQYSHAAKVQLDPDVILVPIHVIQLYVKGDGNVEDGWYSQSRARVTFDDYWQAYDDIHNSDPFYPLEVTHYWGDKPYSSNIMQHAQPDRVWTQCKIQFRMVAYTACPVDPKVFDNKEACNSGFDCSGEWSSPQANKVMKAVEECAAAQGKPGKPVIMTGSLDNQNCGCIKEVIGISEPYRWAIVTRLGLASNESGTPAHELGHLMGIKYHTSDTNDLMYEKRIPGSPLLLGSKECADTRPVAQTFQNEQWPPP
jgi:hypothetical protein